MDVPKYSPQAQRQLAEFAARFRDDPYGFVMAFYPWGQPRNWEGDFNPLQHKTGPEPWQERLLKKIGDHCRENNGRLSIGLWRKIWRSARASGHGVGKSALVGWLIHWVMCTRANSRGIVTANTQNQLETRTWPELAKWHRLLLVKNWFTWTATSYYFTLAPEEERKNYMISAQTVSEHNTEAFQGLHNEEGTILIIFDEASGIASKIWEVAQGTTTDGDVFFLAFGNPTQPTGPFADCFDKLADMYDTEFIDSRSVSHTNKQALDDIIRMYGPDSPEAKVRVYGQFPDQSYNGFIGLDVVVDAINRDLWVDLGAPLIMAVDVARYGDDEIVIGWRQGRDYRTKKPIILGQLSTVKLVEIIAVEANRTRPDCIVIESTGPGAGVIDMLRARGYRVVEVHPGANSSRPNLYYRKRDELWHLMRDWLINEGCLMDDPVLTKQLTSIQYSLDRFEQRTKLESKEDMKARTGLSSPDRADTLALTFAVHLARRDANLTRAANLQNPRNTALTEYDEFAHGGPN